MLKKYIIIMEIISVYNWNYITTNVTIPLVIHVTLSMILFKSQLSIKLFYTINTVVLHTYNMQLYLYIQPIGSLQWELKG